jgi:hypothetical protein
MRRSTLLGLALVLGAASPVHAEATSDCNQSRDNDRAIRGCTQLIQANPRDLSAYFNRGLSYRAKGDNSKAVADF